MKQALRNIIIMLGLLMAITIETNPQEYQQQVVSKINTEQHFLSPKFQGKTLYSIEVERIQSSNDVQLPSCQSTERKYVIQNSRQLVIVSLGTQEGTKNRTQTVFEYLTTLDDNDNQISQFEKVGTNIFLITSKRKAYFINPQNTQSSSQEVELGINIHSDSERQNLGEIIILDYIGRALVITGKQMCICKIGQAKCQKVAQSPQLNSLIDAKLFTHKSKQYLFLLTGDQVRAYEMTANDKLENQKKYGVQFFRAPNLHIRQVIKGSGNTLLFLQTYEGLVEVTYGEQMNEFFDKPKMVYSQPGCYKAVGQNEGRYVSLSCSLNMKSFFIMELIRGQDNKYTPQQTIFRSEVIYDISIHDSVIMSRVFSGIKLYWASKYLQQPYPYDYLHAGDIFLHNAIEAKMFSQGNSQTKVIYIATDDEMRRYELKQMQPYVSCYSSNQVQEQYALTYNFPCPVSDKVALDQQGHFTKKCEFKQKLKFSAWEHKQVKISTLLLPFLFATIGLLAVGIILYRVCKRYSQDVELARLKYSTENQFGIN